MACADLDGSISSEVAGAVGKAGELPPSKRLNDPDAALCENRKDDSVQVSEGLASSVPTLSGGAPVQERRFRVENHLHLGLNLRVGREYSERELRDRCLDKPDKLSRLEQCLADPKLMTEIVNPLGVAEATEAKHVKAREKRATPPESADVTPEPVAKRPAIKNYVVGQLVWSMACKVRRLARLVDINLAMDEPYLLRFYDSSEGVADAFEKGCNIEAVKLEDLANMCAAFLQTRSSSASAGNDAAAAPPARRPQRAPGDLDSAAGELMEGTVVWVHDGAGPPWPAQVASGLLDGANYRVRLLGASDATDGLREMPARQLAAFQAGDARALAAVAEQAEEAHSLALMKTRAQPRAD
eukprot:TRINITY_DN25951_c0_g2_i2.p1 TRINITY_DN25951_c0_g2~~TRINITY_DN25951_c0_g2_i2.p1  ORF type:complete len:356 (+),score=60.64 TRINITY_DN25951_c0_g2_i2:70-1137(+)